MIFIITFILESIRVNKWNWVKLNKVKFLKVFWCFRHSHWLGFELKSYCFRLTTNIIWKWQPTIYVFGFLAHTPGLLKILDTLLTVNTISSLTRRFGSDGEQQHSYARSLYWVIVEMWCVWAVVSGSSSDPAPGRDWLAGCGLTSQLGRDKKMAAEHMRQSQHGGKLRWKGPNVWQF